MSGLTQIIRGALAPLSEILKEAIPDADRRREVEAKITLAMLDQEASLAALARDVVVAEAQGESWLQRNWRPLAMLSFVAILLNTYVVAPYVPDAILVEMPQGMWGLLQVGLGGYVVGRTIEKTGSGVRVQIGQNHAGQNHAGQGKGGGR